MKIKAIEEKNDYKIEADSSELLEELLKIMDMEFKMNSEKPHDLRIEVSFKGKENCIRDLEV